MKVNVSKGFTLCIFFIRSNSVFDHKTLNKNSKILNDLFANIYKPIFQHIINY